MLIERRFTVELGLYRGIDAIQKAFTRKGCWVSERTKPMLEDVASRRPHLKGPLNLAAISVAKAGFNAGGTYEEICSRAIAAGLHLCPAEVAPLLRLAYLDQEVMWPTYIGMRRLLDQHGSSFIFACVRGQGGLLLWSDFVSPHTHLHPEDRIVFAEEEYRPRQVA